MILSLALRYQKHIALFLLSISFVQLTIAERIGRRYEPYQWGRLSSRNNNRVAPGNILASASPLQGSKKMDGPVITLDKSIANHSFIGGPTQPESQSFSSVNSNNMVDLFSGDFSYNIPLLDVGGYPVNIAYHSGITMDEEASWVGLGWNINPGSITRNMRGVPDDFNGGADTMRKVSNIKPNDNWGVTVGGNMEIFGLDKLKKSSTGQDPTSLSIDAGMSLGVFHNTYNGWGFEQSLNASLSVGAKQFGSLTGGLSLTNNTQNGITLQPSLSYQFRHEQSKNYPGWSGGLSVSAPYNSMTGLKGIQMGLNSSLSNRNGASLGAERSALLFAWAPYTPYITMPMTNFNNSVTFKLGDQKKGHHASTFISGYWGSEYIESADTSVAMPVFGYLNYQNFVGNRDALTDFNREKEITYREKPAVPHIGVPTYTYDVFSMSGEGTGGTFRPYRGDIGYISDHRILNKTKTNAFSGDLGFGDILHAGVDLNFNYSYTQSGPWEAENEIGNTINFRNSRGLFEATYFRNPGEKAINTKAFYDKLGGDDVVAPALSQNSKNSPTIIAANTLNRYSGRAKVGSIPVEKDSVIRTKRDKRAQVISYLTASEASVAGLDKYIYHHKVNTFTPRHCDDISVSDTISLGTGLNGYFYKNTEFRGPWFVPEKFNETMHHDWERWTPYYAHAGNKKIEISDSFPNDNFTVRWLGRLKAPETGTYDFGVVVDDRIRVWLDDSVVIDTWKPRTYPDWPKTKLNLIKDHFYKLKIEYLELGGDGFAYAHLFWRTPSQDHTKEFTRNNYSGDKDTINIKHFFPPVFTDTAIVDNVITREDRVNNFRKASHISEIDVLNPDGRRYVYGIPVYNIEQKEVSFSVDKGNAKNNLSGMTTYSDQENSTRNISGKQGYYSRQEIPAYAHSFLLSGILSPDYVDVTGNGISDDDQGDAVKFNYSKTAGIASPYEWRAPYSDSANYAEGLKTYNRDDKANYVSGKKEMWYLHTIESKTMIATFTLQQRDDLLAISEKGVKTKNGKALCLKQIDLYSKADFLAHDTNATPIKTVHFDYSYELCRGINKYKSEGNDSGKLTLKRIWFTYNGNNKGRLNPYEFYYHNNNPRYITNATDKWGTYKNPMQNPGATTGNPLSNADYPYALQDSTLAANNAAAWTMDSIKLPSGGGIKVKYESDDYGYVQNRRATQMMELAGFGTSNAVASRSDRLYNVDSYWKPEDQLFTFVRIPVAVQNDQELYARYLEGMGRLYFRVFVKMPSDDWGYGSEYISCYAEPDTAYNNGKWYGKTSDPNIIWIKVAGVNKAGDGGGPLSPLAQAAINFVRLNLPSKANGDAEPGDKFNVLTAVSNIVPLLPTVVSMLNGFNDARKNSLAAVTTPSRSYVRLNSPTLKKYGGGLRVKTVLVYDSWDKMTQQKDKKQREAVYGQHYDYTMEQNVNGVPTRISSGVAAWEPMIGAEENPFHLPIEYRDKVSIMAPAATLYSEEPLGEAFFPGASIGYRNVRVRSIHTNKTRSANGYSESRFYTTYDFPTTWDWSVFDNDTKKRYKPALRNFLRIDARNYLAVSQGFKVELNDMNGKLRSEATYSEVDSVGLISYTENFYRVDNNAVTYKKLNNMVTTISPDGTIDTTAIIGKDVELMADMREQTSVSVGANVSVNVDLFAVPGAPAFVIVPSLIPLYQKETTRFRSAAMTKVIYRYGIIDSVVHIEKGSKVSTKNMLYDSETGDPLLTRTQNEFNDPIYQFSYPAHWAYKGVGPAYQNIGALLMHLEVRNGKITQGINGQEANYLMGGDELLAYSKESYNAIGCAVGDTASFADRYKLWVIDSNIVHGGAPQLFLVDRNGVPFSGNDVTLKVIRSGHRNINGAVGSVVSLRNPMRPDANGNYHLVFDTATHVVNADASEMAQFWKVADRRKNDVKQTCIATREDSTLFAQEACNCMLPFFDHLIKTNQLFVLDANIKTIGTLAGEIDSFDINNCPLLKRNKDQYFKPITADPVKTVYECYIGNVMVELYRRTPTSASYYDYTIGTCTPGGVIFRRANVEIPSPDTVTVRIAPNFSASLLSTQTCPTFRDSLTLIDSVSDRLMTENNLNIGVHERNALAVLDFNNINDQVPHNAEILSARMLLQADQRGHKPGMWPNANSVNPVDTLSVSLITPGWYSKVPLVDFHEKIYNSKWHREVKRTVPFQNDTINVKDYVEGYRIGRYVSTSFMLTQGAKDFHADTSACTFGEFVEPPGYLQSGYGNYYSTWYSQRYADAAKWPVIEVTYVVKPRVPDTAGLEVRYNSTKKCSNSGSSICYSSIIDTSVNPYQYGILGNFRPLRSYVYYGSRVESDTSKYINTRTFGVIKDFAPFWVYQNNQWVPSYDTTRWVWNSQTTLFNRKGFELENKDPLGRYNSGVYGYGLTLPTAVLQNSHYQEGAYEGFEDYGFETNTCNEACPITRSFDFSPFKAGFTTTQAHTGRYSLKIDQDNLVGIEANLQIASDAIVPQLNAKMKSEDCGSKFKGMKASTNTIVPNFAPIAGKKVLIGGWVKEDNSCMCKSYTRNHIRVSFTAGGNVSTITLSPAGNLVEGWQRYESIVDIPANAIQMKVELQASDSAVTYFDDIRIHPFNAQMKSFVYNAVNLRLMAELDENNYATFYEYDDDGTLVRVKKETERGVQTIKESRSALFKEQ
ncbi:PA14 domain-containing protein [Niastella sp. OAS944]|uniref:PA14 domain-containing protein n=1 Tax=Niastella sp. OAS944 TaxID=2664089 RepID=UPI003474624F|nr:hypothetical protein [Chitinophagaceae bacterium OAS944]